MSTFLIIVLLLAFVSGEGYGLRRGNLLVSDGSTLGILVLATLWAIGRL
jgi:hypothetical protein